MNILVRRRSQTEGQNTEFNQRKKKKTNNNDNRHIDLLFSSIKNQVTKQLSDFYDRLQDTTKLRQWIVFDSANKESFEHIESFVQDQKQHEKTIHKLL